MHELIGQWVMHKKSRARGHIISVDGDWMTVKFREDAAVYSFPGALASTFTILRRDHGVSSGLTFWRILQKWIESYFFRKFTIRSAGCIVRNPLKKKWLNVALMLKTQVQICILQIDISAKLHYLSIERCKI